MRQPLWLQNLRSKKIFAGISIYAASAWVCIQVPATIKPYLNWSDQFIQTIIFTVISFFPFFIFDLWLEHKEVYRIGLLSKFLNWIKRVFDKMGGFFWTIPVLLFGLNYFLISGSQVDTASDPINKTEGKLAVLHFENQTNDSELDILGSIACSWITEGLVETEVQVVSSDAIQRGYNLLKQDENIDVIYERLGVSQVIQGSYFLLKDSLHINANLVDIRNGNIVHTFGNFKGKKDEQLDIVENVKQKILGYWFNHQIVGEKYIPRYDAYKSLVEAKKIWEENDMKIEELLINSMQLDPNFLEPKFLITAYYINKDKFEKADSIISEIETIKSSLPKNQSDRFKYFNYFLKAQYEAAYPYLNNYLASDPSDEFKKTSLLFYSNINLNDPELTLNLTEKFIKDSIDYKDCHYCKTQLLNKFEALLKLKRHKQLNKLFQQTELLLKEDTRLSLLRLRNLVHVSKPSDINEFYKIHCSFALKGYENMALNLIAVEYLKIGDSTSSQYFRDLNLASFKEKAEFDYYGTEDYGFCLSMNNEWEKARDLYKKILVDMPEDRFMLSRLACCENYLGNHEEAEELKQKLEGMIPKFDFGYHSYEMARLAAVKGNKEEALEYLATSVREGRRFRTDWFDRDWYLKSLWDDPKMAALLDSRKISK